MEGKQPIEVKNDNGALTILGVGGSMRGSPGGNMIVRLEGNEVGVALLDFLLETIEPKNVPEAKMSDLRKKAGAFLTRLL